MKVVTSDNLSRFWSKVKTYLSTFVASAAIKLRDARYFDGIRFDGTADVTHSFTANSISNNVIVCANSKRVERALDSSAVGTRISVYLGVAGGYAYNSGVATTTGANTVNRVIASKAAKLRVYTTSTSAYADLPIVVGGEYAGEGFWNEYDTMQFELRQVTVKTAGSYTGSNTTSANVLAWVAVDAQIIYKGSNANGNYVKYRDGKIEQTFVYVNSNSNSRLNFIICHTDNNSVFGIATRKSYGANGTNYMVTLICYKNYANVNMLNLSGGWEWDGGGTAYIKVYGY